jgi:hypothetical protein
MTITQTLRLVHSLVSNLKVVMEGMLGDRQRVIRTWLSPPDPSTNHNISREAHRPGSAAWFTQGSTFDEWKSTGSLLWIHGKRMSSKFSSVTGLIVIGFPVF